MSIRILIADDIEETRSLLKQVLTLEDDEFEVVGEAGDGEEVLKLCRKLNPDVILMDINMPKMNGLEATEEIMRTYPDANVIIMSVQNDTEYLRTAMEAGAKGYILKPINHEEVSELIKKTHSKGMNRKKSQPKEDLKDAKILSFYSFKGGVGKSVIALNTSVIMAEKLNHKVLLIDLDLHFGDISLLTNKHTEKNVLDLVDDDMTDSYEAMKNYFYNYCKNLDVLYAPLSPEGADYVSKDIVNRIISTAKQHYDYIVIDTGVNFHEHTLFALDSSDKIFFISSMEMTSIKNSKLGLGVMKSLNYEDDKVEIIINLTSEKFGISKKDIEKVFDRKVSYYIQEELKPIRFSVNRGQALALDSKGKMSRFYKTLLKLCKEL
ncbi:MAG: response regulator [Clostridiales bacterium]|nr:response regulator [Clostridiales bacterium]